MYSCIELCHVLLKVMWCEIPMLLINVSGISRKHGIGKNNKKKKFMFKWGWNYNLQFAEGYYKCVHIISSWMKSCYLVLHYNGWSILLELCSLHPSFINQKLISPNSSYLWAHLMSKIPIEKPSWIHWLRWVTLPKMDLSVSWNRPQCLHFLKTRCFFL